MNQNIVEMDPLSVYDYQTQYNNSNHEINSSNNVQNGPFNDNIKIDIPNNVQQTGLNLPNSIEQSKITNLPDIIKSKDVSSNDIVNNDTVKSLSNLNLHSNEKGDLSVSGQNNGNIAITKPFEKGKCKVKKERSNYWSEKITEKDFPFYGCAVCNVCFVDLAELDKHIGTHKDRITSYDLRVKNQLKRKKLKKEKKKLKKLGKAIKKEEFPDIEIKPEDGYIGNEKASEFENKDNVKSVNIDTSNDKIKQNKDESKVEDNKALLNLQKIFKCFACQKQFTLSYYLKLHVRSHTDEKPYTCAACGQSFITASKLGRHNKRFHLQVKYQCRICFRYFSRFECLTTHFDRKHPDDKIEGEPYDYNAILPYLKELEEQLKEKSEQSKPAAKELWTDGWTDASNGHAVPGSEDQTKAHGGSQKKSGTMDHASGTHFMARDPEPADRRNEWDCQFYSNSVTEDNEYLEKPVQVDLEEVKPVVQIPLEEVEIEIKTEVIEQFEDEDVKAEDVFKNESPSRDGGSEDDYFPDNTWAATKEEELPPPPADPLTCRVCSKKISTASYMKIHMRTHTGEKPFKCYICDNGFITSSKMHRHVLTHTTAFNDGTLDVKKEEGTEDKLKTENAEEDNTNEDKSNADKSNEKSIGKKVKFTKKSKKNGTDKKKRPHACEFCHQRFLHLETLQVHKMSHQGQAIVYKCHYCLVEVEDEESLKAHEATHEGPKPYLCTICGKVYKKRESMVYHRKHHKSDSVFVCTLCTKSFSTKCKLQRHALTHRRERYSLRYECPVCAHMFHTKYHVRMHLATHQREGLIVEQNRNEILAMVLQNARKVPKASSTGNTENLVPSDERSRVCNICGEVFQHFFYLEEHLKNHASKIAIEDEEKPEDKKHVCQVCNKSFKLHYYLKLHSFTHTKEKPYICQQCGKGFITRGKLKRHLETHAGLKKFQCHVCYKYFTRPSYLRTHVRTIHGTQDYNFRLAQNLGMTYPSAQLA